jgi:hypothetical protein
MTRHFFRTRHTTINIIQDIRHRSTNRTGYLRVHVYTNITEGTNTVHRASPDFHIVKPASEYFIFAVQECKLFFLQENRIFLLPVRRFNHPPICWSYILCSVLNAGYTEESKREIIFHGTFFLKKEKLSCSVNMESIPIYNRSLRVSSDVHEFYSLGLEILGDIYLSRLLVPFNQRNCQKVNRKVSIWAE